MRSGMIGTQWRRYRWLAAMVGVGLVGLTSQAVAQGTATATPTLTATVLVYCTPPPCQEGEVFYCPGECPGGCGTECATPTPSLTPTDTPTATPGPEISITPSTLSLGCQGFFEITITSTGPPGTTLEITSITLAHGYSQGYYGTGFSWDLSQITLPASLASGATLSIPVAFSAADQIYPSRLELTSDSNAANSPHLFLVYFGGSQDACATPTPTPTIVIVDHPTPTETPPPTPTATFCPTGTPCPTGSTQVCGPDHPPFPPYNVCDCVCASVTDTPTPTATATVGPPCVGDCGEDGTVTVDEILTMVNIALGNVELSTCEDGDGNGDGQITIDEILTAVNHALTACPGPRVCGGIDGLPCGSGEVCDLRDPTCAVLNLLGVCVSRPEICPDVFDPVCGCDGVTYANECLRLNVGAKLAHAGACP